MLIEKGTELNARLLKADVHPIIKETLVNQQQQIFFLRKSQTEQASLIEGLVDIINQIATADHNIMTEHQKLIRQNKLGLIHDQNNDEE